MIDRQVDVLIIGGGLTGAALSRALNDAGIRALLVEARAFSHQTAADFDARTLALSPSSIRILELLSVWPLLAPDATAIDTIHVSDKGQFGRANLHRAPQEPLGYVVEMQHIQRALHQLLTKDELLAPALLKKLKVSEGEALVQMSGGDSSQEELITINARIIVAADGSDSSVRKLCKIAAEVKDYHQQALVANIGLARHHQNIAYERFTQTGPLALLPMTGTRAALVWSLPPEKATTLQALDAPAFLRALQAEFGYRLGRFIKAGRRTTFPLRQVMMSQTVHGPLVFVGNAAHTLHPVAGQGFNLGLRDVALLAQCLIQNGLTTDALETYQRLRRFDQAAITGFTNTLVDLFLSKTPGLGLARGAGLIALDNAPPLKNLVTRYASGFGGVVPDLACRIPLRSRCERTV